MSEKTKELIKAKCLELSNLLCQKNEAYGDSAFSGTETNVFSNLGVIERLRCRMDDKIARIKNGKADVLDEDTYMDLAGYLILYLINRDMVRKISVRGVTTDRIKSEEIQRKMDEEGLLIQVEDGKGWQD